VRPGGRANPAAAETGAVSELRVPAPVAHPFRAHYRSLVLDSLLRAAESQVELHVARGRRFRAWRAERTASRLRGLVGAPAQSGAAVGSWVGPRLRSATRIAWVVTLALLLIDLVVFGIHSWATSAADLGLIGLTLVWFFVSVSDPGDRGPTQLTLFR
jgi:hypothetical protein